MYLLALAKWEDVEKCYAIIQEAKQFQKALASPSGRKATQFGYDPAGR